MFRQTLMSALSGGTFAIRPNVSEMGIIINNIKLDHSKVVHHDFRVDISENGNFAYLVEHPVAFLTILGIHDAIVNGTRKDWDFHRATDRSAYARDLQPSAVVGPSDGTIGGDLKDEIESIKLIRKKDKLKIYTLKQSASYKVDSNNKINFGPATAGQTFLSIKVMLFNMGPISAILHPEHGLVSSLNKTGLFDTSLKKKVIFARTPAMLGITNEALFHALGDLAGDIAGIGNLRAGNINATLGRGYHRTTIGFVKHVHSENLVKVLNFK
ncbi:MAG: hypothetical protein ACTSWN_14715 [Promethearchaeota archaeon]